MMKNIASISNLVLHQNITTDLCQICEDLHRLFRTGVILDLRAICVNLLKSEKIMPHILD